MEISVNKWNALSSKEQEHILKSREQKRAIVVCVCGHPQTQHSKGVCNHPRCSCEEYKRGN